MAHVRVFRSYRIVCLSVDDPLVHPLVHWFPVQVARASCTEVRVAQDGKRKSTYTEKCDIWSTGALLLVLLSRRLIGRTFPQVGKAPTSDWIRFLAEDNTTISDDLKHLFGRIFVDDEHRISVAEIKQHPWYLGPVPDDAAYATELFGRHPPKFADSIAIAPRAQLAAQGSVFYATAVGKLTAMKKFTGVCGNFGFLVLDSSLSRSSFGSA